VSDPEIELLQKIHSTLLDIKAGIARIEDNTGEAASHIDSLNNAIGQLSGQMASGNLPPGRAGKKSLG
jgi:hypothetical protein